MKLVCRLVGLLLLCSLVALADTEVGEQTDPGLERYKFPPSLLISVLDSPHKARVHGTDVVCYELLVTNLEESECKLEALECVADGQVIRTFSPDELPEMSRRLSLGATALEEPVLSAKDSVVFYLWLEQKTPLTALHHRLRVDLGKGPITIEGAQTQVDNVEPVLVGLPFRAQGRWAAIGAPSNQAGHRRAVLVVGGRPWISQRFAIDWVLLGPDGFMSKGDGTKNEDHYCYGAEALAVADGEIVDTYDKVPSQEPSINERAVPITLETVGGNWVALKIDENRYGMYAHLIPGSLKVKKGDRVKKGDVLGLVGNTGNSTAPHLHFHVSSTPHWISSVGLPYRIDSYLSVGKLVETNSNSEGYTFEPHSKGDSPRMGDLPQESEVIWVGER